MQYLSSFSRVNNLQRIHATVWWRRGVQANTTDELRRSSRLQGLPPEFGILPDRTRGSRKMLNEGETVKTAPTDGSSAQTNVAPVPILSYQLPRNPCVFSGDDQQDVGRWLKDFERIASYNHWDEQMRLANVIFYLAGTARQWFDNNEDTFTNWTVFKTSLNNTFGRTDDVQRQAERLLLTRVQQTGESSESYIQDVLALCRKVNPSMPEDEKVAHLMKGIAEDLYQILLVQEYDSVDKFVQRCRQIESLRRKRIARPRFQRLPNVATVSTEENLGDIRSLIRVIVKEELQKIFPEERGYMNDESESSKDIASVVREEVMEALAPLTSPRRRPVTRRPSVPNRPTQPRRENRNIAAQRRRTDIWRTETNVPLCYHCGRPGHVLRYCRERRQIFANARAARTDPRREMDNESLRSFDDQAYDQTYPQPSSSSFRSSSPYPRRSFNRRQSQSPIRRSSRSPRRPNEEN